LEKMEKQNTQEITSGPNNWVLINVNATSTISIDIKKDGKTVVPTVELGQKEIFVFTDKGQTGTIEIKTSESSIPQHNLDLAENGHAIFVLFILNQKTNKNELIVSTACGFLKEQDSLRVYFAHADVEFLETSLNFKYRHYTTALDKQPVNSDLTIVNELKYGTVGHTNIKKSEGDLFNLAVNNNESTINSVTKKKQEDNLFIFAQAKGMHQIFSFNLYE